MAWRPRASSLKLRIAATIFCLEAVMVAVLLVVTLRYAGDTARAALAAADRQAAAMFQDLARVALLNDEYGGIQSFIEEARANARLRRAALIDLSGMVVAASDPARIGVRLPDRAGKAGWPPELIGIGSGAYRLGWLSLEFSDDGLAAAYRGAARLGIGVAALGMVIIALVGFTLGHLLTRRLARLAAVADAVSAGATDRRAGLAGRDEVARVGRAFDAMVDRLAGHLASVRLDRDRLVLPTEAMHEGFALWDAEDRLVRCNDRLRELLGTAGPLLAPGLGFHRFARIEAARLGFDEGSQGMAAWRHQRTERHRAGAAGQEHGFADGRWVRVSESRLPDGGAISIYTDVTEAKTRELALRRSERRLRAIMDSVHEGIVTLDADWRVEQLNPAAAALFALPADAPVAADAPAAAAARAFDDLLRPAGGADGDGGGDADGRRGRLVGRGPVEMVGRRADRRRFAAEVSVNALDGTDGPAYIVTVRDVTSQKADRERMLFHATHDPLTGLPNRRLFDDRLGAALRNAGRRGEVAAVALLDLDRFKAINDGLGHGAGDEVLATLARRFAAALRASDTVARLGGDEFIFVLTDLTAPEDALRPAAKLLEVARRPMHVQGKRLTVAASMGVSLFPSDGQGAEALLKHADAALYRAKARGRDRVELFDPATAARAALASDLREARAQRQLRLFYQPQVDLRSGELVGFEAQMRWRHPRRGLLGSEQFLGLADDSGLIGSLSHWALRRACRDLAAWRPAAAAPVRVSVKVSARQIQVTGLVGQVERSLAEAGLAAERLEIEVPESALLAGDQGTARALARLRALGVGLALDDVGGGGHAALGQMRRHPIRRLRIDRSRVEGLGGGGTAVARRVIGEARALGLIVLAEGIETQEQLVELRQLGCQEGQGDLLGAPVRAGEVPTLLAAAA